MSAKIIDGKAMALAIREEIKNEVATLVQDKGISPKLVVVLVGEDPASQVYVRNKKIACEKAGILSEILTFPETLAESTLLETITKLNQDPGVHGILVQLPLPGHIQDTLITEAIDPRKDVDAFHPQNVGALFLGRPQFMPCTPCGILEMFRRMPYETKGKHVVILGRSAIVGKPMMALMLAKGAFGDATVTVCHSRTPDLAEHTRKADIFIAAMGKAEFIGGDMVRPGAVVIDVGINRVEDPNSAKGYRLAGDVHFEEAQQVASWITPVPGGVGPMTIAMLLRNTLLAASK